MKRELVYEISRQEDGMSILQFLKSHGYSRNVLVQLKKTREGILKNGSWAYVNELLHTGDILNICLMETEGSQKILPVYAPLAILYEDEDLLVIDKDAGMPIHPSMHHYEHTLANALAFYHESRQTPMVFRCVNRLDRDTSGLTIVAKHLLSSGILGIAMKNHQIHREYLGIAEGFVEDSGTICAPIARKSDSVIERVVDFSAGESAITHFRRLKYENGLSLVSFRLETGRTHQIRVHMKYIGHPLIGDFLYHPQNRQMKRQALHAWHLDFFHPITGMPLAFEAPVPDDFLLKP